MAIGVAHAWKPKPCVLARYGYTHWRIEEELVRVVTCAQDVYQSSAEHVGHGIESKSASQVKQNRSLNWLVRNIFHENYHLPIRLSFLGVCPRYLRFPKRWSQLTVISSPSLKLLIGHARSPVYHLQSSGQTKSFAEKTEERIEKASRRRKCTKNAGQLFGGILFNF